MSESLNLGTLRSQVELYLLNTSTDANSLSWTVAEINDYINEGIFYTQQVTSWFQDFDTIVCTASVSTYTARATAQQFIRLTWDRVFLPQTNEYELDRDDPSWRAAPNNNPFRFYFPQFGQQATLSPYPTPSQNGTVYTFNQETGAVAALTLDDGTAIAFNQETGIVIQVTDSTETIMGFRPDRSYNPFPGPEVGEIAIFTSDKLNIGMAFVRIPDPLVLDTDTPQLPIQCHFGLVFYALMKCFLREGEFQDLEAAQGWFQAYGEWMESILENKARWWATRVKSLEPFEEGSLFAQRMNSIGYPMQLDLKPSYGS
jgi:hypothetical protein